MNKSYTRKNFNRQKISHYAGTPNYENKEKHFYKRTLKRIAFCIVILLLVILIKNIHSPVTNKTTEIIKTSLAREMDVKKSIKSVVRYAKELPQIPNKVVNVFNTYSKGKKSSMEFVAPIVGDIVSNYGENIDPILNTKTFQRGVDILVNKDESIVTVADGEIMQIGEGKSLGKYIKVKHDNNILSFYANCSDIVVREGQKVKKGEKIASIHNPNENKDASFHFELWVEGKVVDPTQYIPFNRKIL